MRVYKAANHRKNFLECVKSRKPTICPAEIGHRTSTVCQLGNIGYWLRKNLAWDPVKEQFDDAAANKLINREMRGPWKLSAPPLVRLGPLTAPTPTRLCRTGRTGPSCPPVPA